MDPVEGIGLAIATAFTEHGAHVVLSSRSQDAVDKAAKELSQQRIFQYGSSLPYWR